MRAVVVCTLLATLLAVSACGRTAGARAATGGTAGLIVGGPVGAVAGGTIGAATTR